MEKSNSKPVFLIMIASAIGLCVLLRAITDLHLNIRIPVSFLNKIDDWMLPVLIASFIFTIVNIVVVGYKNRNKQYDDSLLTKPRNESFLIKITWPGAVFIILGFVAGFFGDLLSSGARTEAKELLDKLSVNPAVKINGRLVENPKEIVAELKKVVPLLAHHSHPVNVINVEIFGNNEKLFLTVGRDSQNPKEYWVYYPKYASGWWTEYSPGCDLGRIISTLFDDY